MKRLISKYPGITAVLILGILVNVIMGFSSSNESQRSIDTEIIVTGDGCSWQVFRERRNGVGFDVEHSETCRNRYHTRRQY